jgi:subtilase family serine protease
MRLQNRLENGHDGNNLRNHKALASALLLALATLLGCETSPTGPDVTPPVSTPEPAPLPIPPSPTGQADLMIANMHISPASPTTGDEITFRVFVRNAGNAQSAASILRLRVGGESNPAEAPVPALAPGQEHQYERRVTLDVAQSYLATATADARGQVSESNEGNNVDSRSFVVAAAPVQGHPDLRISNIERSPASPAIGDEITFGVYVRNVGNAQARSSTIRFRVGGETFPPEASVPALAPGQEYRYERRVTLNVAQNYLATATADALGQVAESDESNNVLTHNFTVGQADLRIRLIAFSPDSPKVGDLITFRVYVKNEGNAQAGPSWLRFKVGGESQPPVVSIPGLAPGQEYRYMRSVKLTVAQNYLATATADALGQIAESDESNNIRTRSFTVAQ